MNMQQVTGLSLLLFLAARPTGARAMEDAPPGGAPPAAHAGKEASYQRADANFYGKGDVARAHPTVVIIPASAYTKSGDTYTFTPKTKAPKTLYAETVSDWVEPITPPDMPASLGVPPDAMQIREPQGDVQVALPSAPTSFAPVTPNMTLPNGAVLKTGADGTAAVLFGGVDSARLMPNSEAAVQQTVTANSRSAEVDLTSGGVFSKVGTQVGVKGMYEVHTPTGNASAEGGDFVTICGNGRTDVWVAAGTVELNGTDGGKGPVATSDGMGPLKLMRLPVIADPHASFEADTETLSLVLNFIPLADQKIKALRAKKDSGAALTANEAAYLARLKQVPCVIKLALVEPPAPSPVAAAAASPAPTAETPVPKTVPPTKEPLNVNVHPDGTVGFRGAKMELAAFQTKLAHIAKVSPDQAFVIHSSRDEPDDKLKQVMDSFHAANLENVGMGAPLPVAAEVVPAPQPKVTTPALAPLPMPAPAPTPAAAAEPVVPATPAATTVAVTPASNAPQPLKFVIRADGKINFQKVTLTSNEFKSKINSVVQATPDQPIVIKVGKTVSYEKFENVMNICHAAQVKNLSVAGTPPTPADSDTENLPGPGLLMHPSMGPATGATPNLPTTNAHPSALP